MKKIKNLNDLEQTHGNFDEKDTEPTTIDQVLGDTGLLKYNTLDEKEYLDSLNSLNKSDLYAHAVSLGYVPVDNRTRLINRLLSEFRTYTLQYKQPRFKQVPQKPASKEVLSIMSEGR